MNEPNSIFGIPVGREMTVEALITDLWNPETDEIFPPKKFIGLGWGLNFHAIAKRLNLLP